jgi:hypothetical protein
MAKLTAKTCRSLPAKDFAGPDRSFPIEDKAHARAALSRAAHKGGAVESEVRAAVHRKFPGIGEGRDKKTRRTVRRRTRSRA